MKNKYSIKYILLVLTILLTFVNFSFASTENISLKIISDKPIYQVGEDVNLTLEISNLNENIIQGQIKGKVIIGDIGYEIQCFDYNAPNNDTQYLGLNPLPASLSNSNRKTMSTLYACGGTQMQSTKTIMDNSPISQSGQETFELGPFTYSYTLNGEDYEVKSNTLNITVVASQNQNQEQQQSSEQQQSNKEQEGDSKQQDQTDTQTNPQSDQSLSKQGQQALANNQQNSGSLNQLKKEITKAKNDLLNTDIQTAEKKSFWLWFLILLIVVIGSIIIYSKYFKKEEIKEELHIIKKEVPRYIKLLNEVKSLTEEKEKAKLLSQAIKTYIAEKNNLEIDLTHSKAIKLTKNKLFIDILNKTESIEFAGEKLKLDYDDLVKKVRGEFK